MRHRRLYAVQFHPATLTKCTLIIVTNRIGYALTPLMDRMKVILQHASGWAVIGLLITILAILLHQWTWGYYGAEIRYEDPREVGGYYVRSMARNCTVTSLLLVSVLWVGASIGVEDKVEFKLRLAWSFLFQALFLWTFWWHIISFDSATWPCFYGDRVVKWSEFPWGATNLEIRLMRDPVCYACLWSFVITNFLACYLYREEGPGRRVGMKELLTCIAFISLLMGMWQWISHISIPWTRY